MPINDKMIDKMRAYWPELSDDDLMNVRQLNENSLECFLMQRFRVSEEEASKMLQQMEEGAN